VFSLFVRCQRALSSAVEHFLHTEGVAGSNPAARTISIFRASGRVAEWLKAPDSKSGVRVTVPEVRILSLPPYYQPPVPNSLKMRIVLLGTAAGGGFPQWNCACALCAEARAGSNRLLPRTQSCVAISADDERWFLLNASPDLRLQIGSVPALRPPSGQSRGTPIEAVLLTNADLDHTLGLMLLREGNRLAIHSSPPVRAALTTGFAIAPALEKFCGITWMDLPEKPAPLLCKDGLRSGLLYHAFAVPGKPPRFMPVDTAPSPGDSVGYHFVDEKSGGRLVFVPDIARIDQSLLMTLSDCDVLLFDGTFWSENEMRDRGVGDTPAAQMGHVPISGEQGSLKVLAPLPVKTKVYFHINNTNPILLEDSAERAAVVAAGMHLAADGIEYVI
jgi:pyrroloquinoline quinone biosynthesis protein B